MRHVIVQGTSEPQNFQLKNRPADEPIAALDGTGFDVALEIFQWDAETDDWVELESPPEVAWLDQAAGTVTVTGVETLEPGSYRVRFKLTDSQDKDGFCPNEDDADLWVVKAVPARRANAV